MGIFDRDTQTATMERPKTETMKSEMPTAMPAQATTTMSGTSRTMSGTTPSRTAKLTFKVRWTNQEGEVVTEYMQTLGTNGRSMATLQIAKPEGWPAGQYKLEFMLGDVPVATMDFEVR